MTYYINAAVRITIFTLIFTSSFGIANAQVSKSASRISTSESEIKQVPVATRAVSSVKQVSSETKNQSVISVPIQTPVSVISRAVSTIAKNISDTPSISSSVSSKQPKYNPVPFAIATDKKNNTNEYNMLLSALNTSYAKVPVRNETTMTEKSFPFSRPVGITQLPVSRNVGSVYWFGGKTHNDAIGADLNMPSHTASSTNMQTWSYSTTDDPWIGRTESAGVYFQGKMYMVSGWNGMSGGCSPDVWSSVNGKGWNLSSTAPAWGQAPLGGRLGHTLVVMGSKMYLIGGMSCATNQGLGDVWVTGDSENWVQLTTNNSVIGQRFDHTAVVLNNKIYVMGGFKICDNSQGTCGYKNDVISSVDGVNWVVENEHAPWLRRSGHMSFVSGGKMYVLGGYSYTIPVLGNASNVWADPSTPNLTITTPSGESYQAQPGYYNDVWSSSDGVTWTQQTSQAEWIWRRDGAGFVIGSTMYVFGGTSQQTYTGFRNDAWKSTDNGAHWQQVSMGPQTHVPVVSHTAIVVPKNFGAGIIGSKPQTQVLQNGFLSQLGLVNLRGYVTTNTTSTQSWFETEFASGYGAFLPYMTSQTPHQTVSVGSNILVQHASLFPENSSSAIRTVVKNNIGTVVSDGMNANIPNCSDGTPHIWLTSPIGAETISGLGGETFYQNHTMTVTWGSCNLGIGETVTVRLARQGSPDMFYFTSANDGTETFQITTSNPSMWTGDYKVRVSNPVTGYFQSGLVHIVQ